MQKIKQFLCDLKEGIQSGFPLCCVFAFCTDQLLGRFESMQHRHIYSLGFVPCFLHMKAYKQTKQQAILELFVESGFLPDVCPIKKPYPSVKEVIQWLSL